MRLILVAATVAAVFLQTRSTLTSAVDLATAGEVAVFVLAVATLAAWVPVQRARRIDPFAVVPQEAFTAGSSMRNTDPRG
jgi:ABC-type lipoprotein release transport system permease subunit